MTNVTEDIAQHPSIAGLPARRLTYTVSEAIEASGLGRINFYKRIKEGVIPSVRIGNRILIPKAAFHRLLGCE